MTQDPLQSLFVQEFVKKLADPKLLWQLFSGACHGVAGLGKMLRREKRLQNMTVSECLAVARDFHDVSCPVTVRGELAPYCQLRNTYNDSFTGLAAELDTLIRKNPLSSEESELRALDKLQWNLYGPSIQSALESGVQVLQLTETEEVKSIPVVLSESMWSDLRRSFSIADRPFSVEMSGGLLSTQSIALQRLIGVQESTRLWASGHLFALIPDARLVEMAALDIDVKPNVSFSHQSTVYLAYLWVVYKDVLTGDYWPIYEYGNIANPRSYDMLADMLMDRVEFYKRRVWRDHEGKRFSIGTAINDELFSRVVDRFKESPSVDRKHLITYIRDTDMC